MSVEFIDPDPDRQEYLDHELRREGVEKFELEAAICAISCLNWSVANPSVWSSRRELATALAREALIYAARARRRVQ